MGKYTDIRKRNKIFIILFLIIFLLLFVRSISSFIIAICVLIFLHFLERNIEEREFNIEWLKLKIRYLENPKDFIEIHNNCIVENSVYLGDCYRNDNELIADIKNYSEIPNERYSKFLKKDWLTKWI